MTNRHAAHEPAEALSRTDARTRFGDLITRARYQDAHTVVTLYGKPAAVIVPWSWWIEHVDENHIPVFPPPGPATGGTR